MAVVSIVGCAGVGKSLLVKQLAAISQSPAFFEGEEGVFPAAVSNNLITTDPLAREKWFIDQYTQSLSKARRISEIGYTCFVDNASSFTIRSYLAIAHSKFLDTLSTELAMLNTVSPDRVVILTATEENLFQNITARGRSFEEAEPIAKQALLVQSEFLKFQDAPGVSVLDRTNLDFHNPNDLARIKDIILR